MSWYELRLRSLSYNRQQKNELYRTREICYQIYISNWMSKKTPMTKEKYWPIDKKEPVVTDSMVEAFRKAKEKYNKEKDGR